MVIMIYYIDAANPFSDRFLLGMPWPVFRIGKRDFP